MDYTELYEAWKREKGSRELQRLGKRFYAELSEYVRRQREERQMLDEKTLKARLTAEEGRKTKRMLTDLVRSRYRKILRATLEGRRLSADLLTSEEEVVYSSVLSTAEEVENVLENILRGRAPQVKEVKVRERPKRILVRFLQAIPAIVGPDMRTYGPFKAEGIASLPAENAESLVKRGIAVEVKVQ